MFRAGGKREKSWVRFCWKMLIRISLSKTGFFVPFFLVGGGGGGGIPSTDLKSRKSTLWVDFSDQIQIRIFEIHSLNVFGGKDLKKVFLTSGFPNKNGTQHMPYMYDMLVVP